MAHMAESGGPDSCSATQVDAFDYTDGPGAPKKSRTDCKYKSSVVTNVPSKRLHLRLLHLA